MRVSLAMSSYMALRNSAGRSKKVSVLGLGVIGGGSGLGGSDATLLRRDSRNCLLLRRMFLSMVVSDGKLTVTYESKADES